MKSDAEKIEQIERILHQITEYSQNIKRVA